MEIDEIEKEQFLNHNDKIAQLQGDCSSNDPEHSMSSYMDYATELKASVQSV